MMRVIMVILLAASPVLAQSGLRTGFTDLDTAWDICGKQTDVAFIADCTALRRIRSKYPLRVLDAPPSQDFGSGNLAYVQQVYQKWGMFR
jgi:hypothetical protein